MKKKIVAILATIAAVFGFGFAANSAMADDQYGVTGAGSISGSVATFTFRNLTPNKSYVVSYDDTAVESATLASIKFSNAAPAHSDGTLTATYNVKAGFSGTITSTIYAADDKGKATGPALASASVTVAATGAGTAAGTANGANGSAQTASTGAAIAPYAVAVVLLAAAGISLVAVRKSSAR